MINQLYTGTPTSRRQVVLPDVGLLAGDPILVGVEPGVMLDNFQDNVQGCTVLFNGTFLLDVVGETASSPQVNAAIKVGANIYADGGILDATTNVRYGFTLNANSGGRLFGTLDPDPVAGAPVGSGLTANVGVRLGA